MDAVKVIYMQKQCTCTLSTVVMSNVAAAIGKQATSRKSRWIQMAVTGSQRELLVCLTNSVPFYALLHFEVNCSLVKCECNKHKITES